MSNTKNDKKTIIMVLAVFAIIVIVLVLLIPVERKRQLREKYGALAVNAETDVKSKYILDHISEYPDEILRYYYSGEIDFAYNYPFHKNDYATMSYTAEELDGRVPALYMEDNRWRYQTMFDSYYIKDSGCAVVSLTMAYIYLTGKTDMDPYKIGLIADELGAIGTFGGITDEYTMSLIDAIGLKAVEYQFFNEDREKDKHADIETMKSILDSGHVIMAGMVGETFGQHALIIKGYDGDNFTINDPDDAENTARAWTYEELDSEMYYMWDLYV